MKIRKTRKTFSILGLVVILFLMVACGEKQAVLIDYGDDAAFEEALNNGENLEGKVVSFVAKEIHPQSALGFNVWAGEHLNFVSERNPDIAVNDQVTVRATTIENVMGSWVIHYEKVENAAEGETTISSVVKEETKEREEINTEEDGTGTENAAGVSGDNFVSTGTTSFSVEKKTEEKKALELVEYGWYINSNSLGSDSIYVDFCGLIHNPNINLAANFPKINVTVKNGDGTILATDSQTGFYVMPEDTITLVGMLSLPAGGITEDTQIIFGTECSDFTSASVDKRFRTTDFTISNVSELGESGHYITGEITNNASEVADMVNLSVVFRKEGKIVYMENTFIDNLQPGSPQAFQLQRYSEWPEHDTIDVSVQEW